MRDLPDGESGDLMSSLTGEFDSFEKRLLARDIECVREHFRIPSFPQISPSAGFLACAAASVLLAKGSPGAALLLASAGATLLMLDAYGFSPLDWLGPREMRSVLVARGTPSGERAKALFFALPLRCRIAGTGAYSRKETIRRAAYAGGLVLSFLLCAVSCGVLLVVLPPVPSFGVLSGIAMLALSISEWAGPERDDGPRNLAAEWGDRLAAQREAVFRPFLLVYGGDGAEVKYFLARHRGALLRGNGVFLEFASGADGPPAVSVAEGPFIPYRTEAALLSLVREAGLRGGLPLPAERTIRSKSPGLFAMARGFRSVTIFRLGSHPHRDAPSPPDAAAGWAERIAAAAGPGPEQEAGFLPVHEEGSTQQATDRGSSEFDRKSDLGIP